MYKNIDEAIKKYKKIAEDERYNQALARNDDMFWNEKACEKIADEYSQLAEWLEELKAFKNPPNEKYWKYWYEKGRQDAIDEIHTELVTEIAILNATDMTDTNLYTFAVRIKEITDRLISK